MRTYSFRLMAMICLIAATSLILVICYRRSTRLLAQQSLASSIQAVARPFDSPAIAVGLRNGTVEILESDGFSIKHRHTFVVNADIYPQAIAFSPRAPLLAIGVMDPVNPGDNNLLVIDVAREVIVTTLRCHTGSVTAVAFSSDGEELYVAGMDAGEDIGHQGEIVVLNTRTWVKSGTLPGVVRTIWDIEVDEGGKYIAAGHGFGDILIWNSLDKSHSHSFVEPSRGKKGNRVHELRFSHDSQYLASAGASGVRVRSMVSQDVVADESSFGECWSIAFFPNSNRRVALTSETGFRIFDAATGLSELQASVRDDGRSFVSIDRQGNSCPMISGRNLILYSIEH